MVEEQDRDWRTSAACRSSRYPSLFDPLPGGIEERRALVICQRCPVVQQCRNDAMLRGDVYGIRGGLPARERERLLRVENLRQWRARQAERQQITNAQRTAQAS